MMVDIADIPKVMALSNEARRLDRAINGLNSSGRIVGLTIAASGDMPVDISTDGWDYPEPMVAAIRDKCQARRDEIDKELGELGITGASR